MRSHITNIAIGDEFVFRGLTDQDIVHETYRVMGLNTDGTLRIRDIDFLVSRGPESEVHLPLDLFEFMVEQGIYNPVEFSAMRGKA